MRTFNLGFPLCCGKVMAVLPLLLMTAERAATSLAADVTTAVSLRRFRLGEEANGILSGTVLGFVDVCMYVIGDR